MARVLVSDNLSIKGIELLEAEKDIQVDVKTKLTPEELKSIIKDYDALIIRSATKVTADLIDAADNLKVVGRAGVGLDNVDIPAASKRGIIVMNTPGGNTIATAEHAFSMLLALSRSIPQAHASMKAGKWDRKKFMGVELYGKVLGIVGLGRVGAEVAKRARAFGMSIIAYDPYLSKERAQQLDIQIGSVDAIFQQADYISVHTPLTDETRHIMSDPQFAIMKDGVRIVNCARGGIIDEEALYRAITSGKVAGAALDVFENEPPNDSPLMSLDQVIATPHLGASTAEAQEMVAVQVAKQISDFLVFQEIRNAVNYPSISPEVFKQVKPYIELAEKLGLLAGQLGAQQLEEVFVRYKGDVTNFDLAPVTVALLKGILTPILQDSVNYVNASSLAAERGIKVVEAKTTGEEDYSNFIAVDVRSGEQCLKLVGTLFSNQKPRIVKINNFYIDAIPSGQMLILLTTDTSGLVGTVGTILGDNNINIGGMTFGRETQGGKAILVVNVDGIIAENVTAQLKQIDSVDQVSLAKF